MKTLVAVASLVLFAACSSEQGLNPAIAALYGNLKPGADGNAAAAQGPASAQRLTRAMIDKSGLALIRARLGEDAPVNRLAAVTRHGPYVTYLTRGGQHLTLNGAAITATRGIGHDLLAAEISPNDPLTTLTPPSEWPDKLRREYRFYSDGPAGRVAAFSCRLAATGKGDITIVEVTYRTVRFIEDCTGDGQSFQNVYFADVNTGFIWRSRQWVSPRLPQIDYDVLEPLTDSN